MRSSSRPLGLVTLVAVLAAPLFASPSAPKAAAPAGQPAQANAADAKPASAAPQAQAAASASSAASTAPAAQPAAEGVSVANAPATAGKNSCEDVKAGIEAKIKARGVKAFTLDIVGKDEAKDAKVVGSCEGGKKAITYKRG